jgi:acyl-CoA reductase-like NAD-dependent aldehyde dehydrogenase
MTALTAEELDVLDPATGEAIGRIRAVSAEAADAAVSAAQPTKVVHLARAATSSR